MAGVSEDVSQSTNRAPSENSYRLLQTRGSYDMPSDVIKRWPRKMGRTGLKDGDPDFFLVQKLTTIARHAVGLNTRGNLETRQEVRLGLRHVYLDWLGLHRRADSLSMAGHQSLTLASSIWRAFQEKISYYMYQSEWTSKPSAAPILPALELEEQHRDIDVGPTSTSSSASVELFLNGQSLGTKRKSGEELQPSRGSGQVSARRVEGGFSEGWKSCTRQKRHEARKSRRK